MATKCKLLSLCVLILHSISHYCVVSSNQLHNLDSLDIFDIKSPVFSHNIRHSRHRLKRDVTTKRVERSILEDKTNPIFTVRNEVDNPASRIFTFAGSSFKNLFTVDTQGNVGVAANNKLDYENSDMREVTLQINATSTTDSTDVVILNVEMRLQNVNDEIPVFKNQPKPFYAVVPQGARPDMKVYELVAEDPDGNRVSYSLNSGAESRFIVRTTSSFSSRLNRNVVVGEVLTVGSGTFSRTDYQLVIQAVDTTDTTQAAIATVFVRVGTRNPQFYEDSYTGKIPEQSAPNQVLQNQLKIQAISFQNKTITYELFKGGVNNTDPSPYFTIDRQTGEIRTTSTLTTKDLDYDITERSQRPPKFPLTVRATEAETGLFSTTSLVIELIDNNDNRPIFEYSRYQKIIPEDFAVGNSILQVKAVDQDSSTNSELVYSVDDGNFTIETVNDADQGYIGIIRVKERLDYDRIVGHMYSFTVVASDKGSPVQTGIANVRVVVTNVNDEPPEIKIDDSIVFSVREDANINYVVTFIQATDLDGDRVRFFFSPDKSESGIFSINQESGLIRLIRPVPTNVDKYVLNITAKDDGACCGSVISLSSEAYLVVEIVDVNQHKPSFTNCSDYNIASVLEHQSIGTKVITVKAIDEDRNENGRVTYSILRGQNQSPRFNINVDNGTVTTNVEFDRETTQSFTLTVKGNDQANPSLEGYCTFTVTIGDINDNAPVFDQPEYTVTITEDYQPGRSVANVRADDADIGTNAKIEYFLTSNPDNMFKIDLEAGIIYLNKSLSDKLSYPLVVMAKDKGEPPLNKTANVIIKVADITSKPPTWNSNDYSRTYNVSETALNGFQVAEFSATSNIDNPNLVFSLVNNDGNPTTILEPFSIESSGTTVKLLVHSSLDYNIKELYEVRIRVTNLSPTPRNSHISPKIRLLDKNNKVPYFVGRDQAITMYPGSVAENMDPGQVVIDVKAFDDDSSTPYNVLTFSLEEKENVSNLFRIEKFDANTARITTAARFDREKKQTYFLQVNVVDGAPSDIPNHTPPGTPNKASAIVQVIITDRNDNSPFFEHELYNASVKEDAGLQHSIIMVTAQDPDTSDILTYSISQGNIRSAFGVQSKKGIIYVARQLDFENGEESFDLTLVASDGLNSSQTTVHIDVEDVNDNRPQFVNQTYTIANIVEEDTTITPNNKRWLTKVSATDADRNRPNNIRYSLLGYGTVGSGKSFDINPETGDLYLLLPLDRDLPNGRAVYQFNVRAMDEPQNPDTAQYGFASVQVRPLDINDNQPIFQADMTGKVAEHSPKGSVVMSVLARDYDFGDNGTVVYAIYTPQVTDTNSNIFAVNADTGLVTTNTGPEGLDRETLAVYSIIMTAHDKGPNPETSTTTVTVTLTDINDQIPVFQQKYYNVTMSEAQASGEIALVRATDKDIGENARLEYSLAQPDRTYFQVVGVNNEGSIVVYKRVDYENVNERQFNLTVTVQDNDPAHTDTAYVHVTVEDFNDNAPEFQPKTKTKTVDENVAIGTVLESFTATDADSGRNAEFKYSIDLATDKRRQFAIDETTGVVTVRRSLDRETVEVHYINILAIDEGDPKLTGTASFILTLNDINDNYPIFKEDYRPVVPENSKTFPSLVINLQAKDLDTPQFGAPFGFASAKCTDGSEVCPCDGKPTCQFFSLEFDPNGDNGDGEGIVKTKAEFDRENTKYYYMPVVMWDMRDSNDPRAQTGTNTLTIEIGDVNDNKHGPGHKDIFVYNYEGKFGPLDIGNVYATDPDDWDVVDKTFTFSEPAYMKEYFTVNEENGMITMAKGVPVDKDYTFSVNVFDRIWNLNAVSTVTVTVRNLSEEAVRKSGAMRLTGTTAEEFMDREKKAGDITAYEESKSDKFRQLLASKISAPVGNVEVISVMNNGEYTDVRYSAHGSPYYDASKTDSVVYLNKEEFEKALGIKIAMVPIDECRDEKFEAGCYNYLNITGGPAMVNTNSTSFVGVETFIEALEGCRALVFPDPYQCSPDYCYNGGECITDDWKGISCKCPIGYDGPRCQGTHRGFDGNSYALFKPFEQCKDSITSIDIITQQEDGLIFYNGPDSQLGPDEPTDFISLELIKGYPLLRIDHGTGELRLQINGRNKDGAVRLQALNDGKWHHIDIIRDGRNVQLIVDRCEVVERKNEIAIDDEACRKFGETPNANMFLNVNTMLQIGGRAQTDPQFKPVGITSSKFNGCVKNLRHNGQIYNLHIGGTPGYPAGENGCRKEEDICGLNSISGPVCGENGICISSWTPPDKTCICKPGFFGVKCQSEATTKDLRTNSYLMWQLRNAFFNNITPWKLQKQLMFRTRDRNGILMTVSTTDNSKHVTLEVYEGNVRVKYEMGNSQKEQFLTIENTTVSDGRWHVVEIQRYGKMFILKLDEGEGRNYKYTLGKPGDHEGINIKRSVFAGGDLTSNNQVYGDLTNSCMRDVRMENGWFPMDMTDNDKSTTAELRRSVQVDNECKREDCLGITCPGMKVCYPLWGAYECRCPDGYKDVAGTCQEINFCEDNECVTGTCDSEMGMCRCPPGWTGTLCNEREPEPVVAGLTTGAIVAIVVSIFIALVVALVVIFLVQFSKRPKDSDKYILEVDPDDDIRENVMNYDEEGAGEEDHDAFDISRLQKPDESMSMGKSPLTAAPRRYVPHLGRAPRPGEDPDVGGFIDDRLGDADEDPNAPPADSVCEYAYEGGGSDAGSLSSLNTTSSGGDQDYDYLNDWGPKFAKLADMYGAGQNTDSNA
ncbi:hypothetical protein SNE40_017672 [Patella caerulea]|uniref:Uncharacterized protein n=1 Tax=Patella caerulea TaxID=87958 RepID=A0AAN8JEA5_PATCE